MRLKPAVWLALVLLSLLPVVASAANVFVGPASRCSGNGTSWSNCRSWDAVSFVRNNTYYLMDGSYSGKTLSVPANGTSAIVIKKATPADYGGDPVPAGVSISGQAVFTSGFTFESSFWTLDGVKGSWSTNPSDYGFKFSDGQTYNLFVSKFDVNLTDLVFSHFAAKAPTGNQEKPFFRLYTQVGQVDNVTLSHSLLDGYQAGMQSSGQGSAINDNWVFEYNVCLNGFSRNDGAIQFHGEWINADGKQLNNLTVRYNLFKGADGGMTGTITANNATINNAVVYGNVFDGVQVTNGIVTGTSEGRLNNAKVYHNTFLSSGSSVPWVNGGQAGGVGNVARNNLIYAMTGSVGSGVTRDYNAYFSTTNSPQEAHGQISTGNPFTDLSTYMLKAATDPGDSAVPIAYRTDRFGIAGLTRGAVQIGTASNVAPEPPTSLVVQLP